jgi:methylenetetrahydrofolate dehydrogenase (NADP+)/methenyltetrahydrofolate cyclohydrolase
MSTLIDGNALAETILEHVQKKVNTLKKSGVTPKLAVVLIGDDKPSKTYTKKKGQAARKVGIDFSLYTFDKKISAEEFQAAITDIQSDRSLSGLIIQLPMPDAFYPRMINLIRPEIDIDCLTETNLGKLTMETHSIVPPTPGAVLSILESLDVDIPEKNVTIVGTGVLVGKPLATMMMNLGASVSTCNKFTKNTKEKCLEADILISAVGKKNLIRGDMVKPGAIVIDAGVDFEKNQMFGDINMEEVKKKAAYLTPTPGGVGPLTVARLLLNTVICSEMMSKNRTHYL